MIIRNKIVYVYDIEVFPNVFHCAVKNTETGEYLFFEISPRRNDVEKLINFFWQIKEDQRGIWSSNYILLLSNLTQIKFFVAITIFIMIIQ